MAAEFSFIIIRGGEVTRNRQKTIEFMYDILKYIDAQEIQADEFNASYDLVPRIVVQHNKALHETMDKLGQGTADADISMKHLKKDVNFKVFDTGYKNLTSRADPRYGILDAHALSPDGKNVLVLNLAINTMKEFKIKTYLNIGLARKLKVGKSHDVISIVTINDKQIEFYDINSAGSNIHKRTTGASGSALAEYVKETGINPTDILKMVDNNVGIADAPTTLAEIKSTLNKISASINFMKKGGYDKPSITAAEKEIKEIVSVKKKYDELAGKQSTMTSLYFKLRSPDSIRKLIDTGDNTNLLEIDTISDISETK